MKKLLFVILHITLILLFGVISCKKEELPTSAPPKEELPAEEKPKDQEKPLHLVFTSLTATKTTLRISEETQITAEAKGQDLEYHWESERGYLLGKGQRVFFVGSQCCVGETKITCTVKDAYGESSTKTITIVVEQ